MKRLVVITIGMMLGASCVWGQVGGGRGGGGQGWCGGARCVRECDRPLRADRWTSRRSIDRPRGAAPGQECNRVDRPGCGDPSEIRQHKRCDREAGDSFDGRAARRLDGRGGGGSCDWRQLPAVRGRR